MRVAPWLTLLLAAIVAAPAICAESKPSAVVVLEGAVDDRPDAAFANLVRVDFVGCDDLGGRDCGRLANFRFEYAWESGERIENRLQAARADAEGRPQSGNTEPPIGWAPFRTDSLGRAGLPLPPDLDGVNVLHVRLKEPGWEWFTFPGGVHPGTLGGAAALELPSGARNLRATLIPTRSPTREPDRP